MDPAVTSTAFDHSDAVTATDLLAAQARLRRYLDVTPTHYAERFGCWLKLENLQRTGSYKVRGAMNALLAARERGDDRMVISASAGNHAQGLAWAAYRLGLQVIAVMPKTAPDTKIAGVAHWGATVRLHGDTYDEAKAFACDLAAQFDYRLLSAFDDPDVIAGQGTVGLEIASLCPDVVLVPIGGGGLAAGVALALQSQGVRIVGAQVEGVDAMARALRGDRSLRDPAATLADGVRVKEPGYLTQRVLDTLLDDIVVVREAELRETVVRLALEEHIIAEGAGALALAAGRRVAGKRKCAVVSGGNLDAGVLARLLSEVRPRPPRRPRRRTREAAVPATALAGRTAMAVNESTDAASSEATAGEAPTSAPQARAMTQSRSAQARSSQSDASPSASAARPRTQESGVAQKANKHTTSDRFPASETFRSRTAEPEHVPVFEEIPA